MNPKAYILWCDSASRKLKKHLEEQCLTKLSKTSWLFSWRGIDHLKSLNLETGDSFRYVQITDMQWKSSGNHYYKFGVKV